MPSDVRIKLCGFTRIKDVLEAARVGADAVGFIFHQQSIRFISPKQANTLLSNTSFLPPAVGVFVNVNLQQLYSVCHRVQLNILQFHGHNTLLQCLEFSSIVRVSWLYVMNIKNQGSLVNAFNIFRVITVNFYTRNVLLDTYSKQHGGSGRAFNWFKPLEAVGSGLIISGGIVVNNVARLVGLGFGSLDVSSGVETKSRCGKKSLTRIKNMVNTIHHTTRIVQLY